MKKIIVTGGAGYIGSVLCRILLKEGYQVIAIDKLMFGGESIVELLNDENFSFIYGDIRQPDTFSDVFKNVDALVNLAAIVGDPACAKEPDLANETNFEGTKLLYNLANKTGISRFIMASTCSNYGKMKDENTYITEQSELAPVSLYAETKVAAEKYLLSQSVQNSTKPTCLRFSTVYGLSPRIRFDLTVNEFTKELALGRELVIFGEQFWRPYCHVVDLARSVISVLKAPASKVAFEVFNVGDTQENYQKKMLADEIAKQLPNSKVKFVQKDEDPRDYKVAFNKINQTLNFSISMTVPDGIKQIIKVIKDGFLNNPDDPKYRNS